MAKERPSLVTLKLFILVCLLVFPQVSHAEVSLPRTEAEFIQRYIQFHPLVNLFIPDVDTFLEIIRAESNFNPRAMNWNCQYGKKFTSCKKQDRDLAFSVDCGLSQINIKSKVCPEYLFNMDINLAQAVNLYIGRKFQPWQASKKNWQLSLAKGG